MIAHPWTTTPDHDWPDQPSKHFSRAEMQCRGNRDYDGDDRCGCGGELPLWSDQHVKFFDLLEYLRMVHGQPLEIISGHRCLLHKLEETKSQFGAHTTALAADFLVCEGGDKMRMVAEAVAWADATNGGNVGIGIGHRYGQNKLHIDIAPWREGVVGWTY